MSNMNTDKMYTLVISLSPSCKMIAEGHLTTCSGVVLMGYVGRLPPYKLRPSDTIFLLIVLLSRLPCLLVISFFFPLLVGGDGPINVGVITWRTPYRMLPVPLYFLRSFQHLEQGFVVGLYGFLIV